MAPQKPEPTATDDERNGLLLAAGLHRAFDADLWAIDSETLRVVVRPQGPSLAEMGMKFGSLEHVRFPPHKQALESANWDWCTDRAHLICGDCGDSFGDNRRGDVMIWLVGRPGEPAPSGAVLTVLLNGRSDEHLTDLRSQRKDPR